MSLLNQIYTEFRIDLTRPEGNDGIVEFNPSVFPEFCKDVCFNYFSSPSGQGEIAPKLRDVRVLYLNNVAKIYTLELKAAFISYWGEVWLDKDHKVIDPRIVRMNLQNNLLTEFSIEEERSELKYLDLSGNKGITDIYLPLLPKIQTLKLNRLENLETLVVGSTVEPTLTRLEMRESNIPPGLISNISFSTTQGFIDLRGSTTDFNTEDEEVLEFLNTYGYTVLT